ncbi:MAG TPA: HIT domain-containing protein [Candidatus Krumholzibacteria bacterium]|nr:HIT domain-containing protein [Candidatus Krumholzibacteria bacterium]
MMDRLYAPWRSVYLMGEATEGCLFCAMAAADPRRDREQLILDRGANWFIVINRYPYTTGHVMVVSNRHVEKMRDFSADESAEMMTMLARCEGALSAAYHPDGINVGANLGRSAGAGIVGHFHMHLVPRWHGDTNFMSAVGETRVVSEDLNDTYNRLSRALRDA